MGWNDCASPINALYGFQVIAEVLITKSKRYRDQNTTRADTTFQGKPHPNQAWRHHPCKIQWMGEWQKAWQNQDGIDLNRFILFVTDRCGWWREPNHAIRINVQLDTNLCREMSSLEAEELVISTDPLHVRFKINSMDHRTHLVNH